ncbi:glycosyltransferase [Candidatus Woesebacteria bacterium]|nr:glycosyltransferase [Candidatus Woesebacteria bacterium]
MKDSSHFLSLIIPSFKQEKTIVKDIKRIKKITDNIRYDHEIIIVIDGKVDNTLQKLKKTNISNIKIISYQKNQGKSYAIRVGMNKAKGDYVMFVDAGMEIDPNGISMLLEHMEWYNADIIVGSKRHQASQVKYSFERKILSFGYYLIVKTLFGLNVKDTQAGIKIFRKKVLTKILPRLLEKKFAGDLEMLVVAKLLGFNRIYEAPIKLNYKLAELTSAATLNSIKGIFLDTLAIFYRLNILHYYNHHHSRFVFPKNMEIVVKKYTYVKL